MRLFIGIVLGICLTIAAAYIYDSITAGPAMWTMQAPAGDVRKPMVNWDVVAKNLDSVTTLARAGWKRIAG